MTEVKNILYTAENNIINVIEIIIEKENDIYDLYKKDNNEKIKLQDYININKDDNINILYQEIEKINKNKVLEFLDISNEIIENYIEYNSSITKIDNLFLLKKIINLLGSKIKISKDINEIIHKQILNSDKKVQYFLEDEIYFNQKYKNSSLRTLEILNEIDLKKLIKINEELKNQKHTNLEEIFESNLDELYDKIKSNVSDINDIKLFDKLFERKNSKLLTIKKRNN